MSQNKPQFDLVEDETIKGLIIITLNVQIIQNLKKLINL